MSRRKVAKTSQCKTCAHADRARIEVMLANDVDPSRVARQFSTQSKPLSRWAVRRHWLEHVSQDKKDRLRIVGASDITVDIEAIKRLESESLLQNLVAERARLQRIADKAEDIGNYQDATRASTALVRVLELLAKYLGELRIGNTTINNNFLISPDWVDLRRVIATALRPFPDAQRAVVAAIRQHEEQRGVEITHAHAIEKPALEQKVVNG